MAVVGTFESLEDLQENANGQPDDTATLQDGSEYKFNGETGQWELQTPADTTPIWQQTNPTGFTNAAAINIGAKMANPTGTSPASTALRESARLDNDISNEQQQFAQREKQISNRSPEVEASKEGARQANDKFTQQMAQTNFAAGGGAGALAAMNTQVADVKPYQQRADTAAEKGDQAQVSSVQSQQNAIGKRGAAAEWDQFDQRQAEKTTKDEIVTMGKEDENDGSGLPRDEQVPEEGSEEPVAEDGAEPPVEQPDTGTSPVEEPVDAAKEAANRLSFPSVTGAWKGKGSWVDQAEASLNSVGMKLDDLDQLMELEYSTQGAIELKKKVKAAIDDKTMSNMQVQDAIKRTVQEFIKNKDALKGGWNGGQTNVYKGQQGNVF